MNDLVGQIENLKEIRTAEMFIARYCSMLDEYGAAAVLNVMRERLGAEYVSRSLQYLSGVCASGGKRIGTFFFRMGDGGSEQVISRLLPLWTEMGYQTVLFTDEQQAENSPPVLSSTEEVVFDTAEQGKNRRLEIFDRYLTEHPIDCMVYHAWMSEDLFWDILLLHAHGVPVILYIHGIFSTIYYSMDAASSYLHRVYRMSDAVVCLSKVSEDFFQALGCRTFFTCNPVDEKLKTCRRSPLSSETLLWVGRISVEKASMEALRIFEEVHRERDAARMIILGTGNPQIEVEMRRFIRENNLTDSVDMPGFQQDTDRYYAEASVYLTTSAIEGFQYTILESQAHGIPCVMYELPYLQLVQGAESCISVAQGDYRAAAREVVRILEDEALRKELGISARKKAEEVLAIDMRAQWESIFMQTGSNAAKKKEDSYLYFMLEHMMHGIEGEREKIRNTRDYRVGHRLVELPRRVRRAWKSR